MCIVNETITTTTVLGTVSLGLLVTLQASDNLAILQGLSNSELELILNNSSAHPKNFLAQTTKVSPSISSVNGRKAKLLTVSFIKIIE